MTKLLAIHLARFQASQLLTDLKEEDADKFQVIIQNIEDRLLTATRKVISQYPIKLLQIRQEEERRRLKEREIALKEKQLALEIDKMRGSQIDVGRLPQQIIEDVFGFIGSDEFGLKWFKANAKGLEAFLVNKYASETHN